MLPRSLLAAVPHRPGWILAAGVVVATAVLSVEPALADPATRSSAPADSSAPRGERAPADTVDPRLEPAPWLEPVPPVGPAPTGTAVRPPADLGPKPASIPLVDAVVVVPKFGEFRVRFYPEDAPNHVAHFLTLAASGYYDGMTFHRVIPGLLIQAGDPASRDEDRHNDGAGGPGYRLPGEPSAMRRTHRRGSLSFAWRNGRPGTAGSQWFVSLGDAPALDGHGLVIGEIVDGMDTVDRIAQVSTLRNRNPLNRIEIETVRLVSMGEPLSERPAPAAADTLGPN